MRPLIFSSAMVAAGVSVLFAEEPLEKPILRIETGVHTAVINAISADRAGKIALTVSKDKTARIWELPSGRPLRVFRPPIDSGDGGQLYAGALSPDGSIAAVGGYIPTGEKSRAIYLFDTATGHILQTLSTQDDTFDLRFSSSGRFLAGHVGTAVRVWETSDGQEIGHINDSAPAGLSFDWHGDNRLIVAAKDGKLGVFDVTSQGKRQTITDSSTDSQALLAATNVTLDQPSLGRLLGHHYDKPPKFQAAFARFSPDGKRIAVAVDAVLDGKRDGHSYCVVFDEATFKPLFEGEYPNCQYIEWSTDGNVLGAIDNGYIELLGPAGQHVGHDNNIIGAYNLCGLPGGAFLFSTHDSLLGIISAKGDFTLLGRPGKMNWGQSALVLSADATEFGIAVNTAISMKELLEHSGRKFARFTLEGRRWDLSTDDQFTGLRHPTRRLADNLELRWWEEDPPSLVKCVGDYSKLFLGRMECAKCEWSRDLFNPPRFGFSTDKEDVKEGYLVTDTEKGWPAAEAGIVKGCRILSVADQLIPAGAEAAKFHAVEKAVFGVVKSWGKPQIDDPWAARIEPTEPVALSVLFPGEKEPRTLRVIPRVEKGNEPALDAAVSPGGQFFIVGGTQSLRRFDSGGIEEWRRPVPAAARNVNVSADGRLLVVAYTDGTIRWHRANDSKELLAFFPHADGRHWVLWTPQGYYDCSPGGEDLIGWHLNRGNDKPADFFPASRYREQFYRPDIIDRVLETRDVAVAVKQADEVAGKKKNGIASAEKTIEQKQPPVVELAVGGPTRKLEIAPGVGEVTIRYKVRNGADPAKRIRVMVDGRPALVDAPVPKDADTVAVVDVPMPSYSCSVGILAENSFATSEPAVLQIIRSGKGEDTSGTSKPRLFLLSVGVNTHLNHATEMDRPWSKNDAEDFVAALRKQAPNLYSDVKYKILTGSDATAGNILDGFDWLRHECEPHDVVMILLMGHGGNDGNRFYFIPYDFDEEKRSRTSVSYEEIQRCLSNLPGRVLLFVGSCHSGDVLGARASERLPVMDTTQLTNALASEENGVVVFTASTGRQVAWSSSRLRNSLFFTAVLEGLNGKANLLGKGKITVATLEAFISARVPELFQQYLANSKAAKEDGATTQTPTVAKPQTIPDFVIATTSARKRQ